ncbi:MAG: thymidine phosphorylase, partial [Deltaproteobacteria bacterium]|nr:thymidine phosphorylase [Deltaproteobacteria bacterium]
GELDVWTDVMLGSGTVIDLDDLDGPKVDKHSTGGVGDKVSLVLAPLAAACGVYVPMISGRGLGHTGGTLDKLESIPGMSVDVDVEAYRRILAQAGLVFAGQTENLCPADRKLYALRDVTGTVESIPLIASSIMSKKLAEGIDALVLDVKVGRGAFMKTLEDARDLAGTMVRIGEGRGKRVRAVLTSMDVPLGRAAGNSVEVRESVDVLRGEGPEDTRRIVLHLTACMLVLGGVEGDHGEALSRCEKALDSGAALERLMKVVELQGGDPRALEEPERLPLGDHDLDVTAKKGGYVTGMDAMAIGRATVALGAGRLRSEDDVDPGAGVIMHRKPGEAVDAGERLATLHASDASRLEPAAAHVEGGYDIGPEPPAGKARLIMEEVGSWTR